MRCALSRRLQSARLFLLRSISGDGLRQLTYRESLRKIEACLRAMSGKLDHMGFRGKVSRHAGGCQRNPRLAHLRCVRPGAVKMQIWIAVSVYTLVAIVRKQLGVEVTLYQILQVLSLTCSRNRPFLQKLQSIDSQSDRSAFSNQLNLVQLISGLQ